MLSPFTDVAAINALVNHPKLRHRTLPGFDGEADFTQAFAEGRAVFWGDARGGFLAHREEPGVWSIHTQFLPEARGPRVVTLMMQGERFMFTRTDCLVMKTFVATGNRGARDLALAGGFEKVADANVSGLEGEVFSLGVKEWVCQQL